MSSYEQGIEDFVNRVWQFYYKLGITDDLAIIESVAFLFLMKYYDEWNNIARVFEDSSISDIGNGLIDLKELWGYPYSESEDGERYAPPVPEPSVRLKMYDLADLKNLFEDFYSFLSQVGLTTKERLGDILNEFVIPQIKNMSVGGRYPTPRHLTYWAANLVDIKRNTKIADLACGSGGFLVEAASMDPQLTGIEISPNWARVAAANCLLHDTRPDIHIGNSLSVFGRGKLSDASFDVILMNPPFGAKVDESLIPVAFNFKFSGRSETVLTALAMNHLADDGQMVVFLPSGSLFANSGGEQILREGWIKNGQLASVVTLPKDAFQPYSQVATHALLIEKTPQPDHIHWFYLPRFDGFTSGRNRLPDREHDDLPLITYSIRSRKETLPVMPLPMGEEELLGYRVLLPDFDAQLRVDRLTHPINNGTCFLISFGSEANRGYFWIDQTEILRVEGGPTPIVLSLPDHLDHPISETFLSSAFTFKLQTVNSEIVSDRGKRYPIEMPAQWEETSWMGIVVNPDGIPISPAFKVDVPDSIEKNKITVFPWDYDIPFDDNVDNTDAIRGRGNLVLFPPGPLEGLRIAEGDYLLKSGKNHWLRIRLNQNSFTKFDLFVLDDNSLIFESDGRQCGLLFTSNGEVLGVAVPGDVIQKTENLDLQPASYFPRIRETGADELDSPAQILADIQKAQYELSSQIGKLLSLAEMKPTANEPIPPRLLNIRPVGRMQGIQKDVWEVLQAMVEEYEDYRTPKPFRVGDIEAAVTRNLEREFLSGVDLEGSGIWGIDPDTEQDMQKFVLEQIYTEADLLRVIDLFERMGLIVRISINGSEYYRLVSERETVGGNPR